MSASAFRLHDPDHRYHHEIACQPELIRWLEDHPDKAAELSADEVDELLSLNGTGGPLTYFGVEHHIAFMEDRRSVIDMVRVLHGTDKGAVLKEIVASMYKDSQILIEAPAAGDDTKARAVMDRARKFIQKHTMELSGR